MSQVSRLLISETTDPPLESQCIPMFLKLGKGQAPLMSFHMMSEVLTFGTTETRQMSQVLRRLITETTDPLESQCIPMFLKLGEGQAPLMPFRMFEVLNSDTTQKNRQIRSAKTSKTTNALDSRKDRHHWSRFMCSSAESAFACRALWEPLRNQVLCVLVSANQKSHVHNNL